MKFKLFIIATMMLGLGLVSGVSAETADYSVNAEVKASTQVTPVAASSVSVTSYATLRPGMKGAAVRALQELLQEKGYYTLNVDGSYGPGTTKAVARFQAMQGLTPDGIAGARTFAKFAANGNLVLPVERPADNVADTVNCTMEYAPVCGQTTINCVTTPCPQPAPKTYGNECMAKAAGASILYKGACEYTKPVETSDEKDLSNSDKKKLIVHLEAQIERLENHINELELRIKRIKNLL